MTDAAEIQSGAAGAPAAQKPSEDADARAGFWRRSELWDFEDAIRKRIAEGRSYPQILNALQRLGLRRPIGVRRLAQFCVEQLHIHSLRPSRHDRARAGADKTSAPAPTTSGLAPPTFVQPTTPPASLADAFGPEPGDPLAGLRPTASRSKK